MQEAPVILIAEDDEGHAFLVKENLRRSGLSNRVETFRDGQEILDFLFGNDVGRKLNEGHTYLLLLDIRMPKVDGIEVLRQIKADPNLRRLPVMILTTTDDPREVERCHEFGCSVYLQKPVDYEKFAEAVRRLGLVIALLLIPPIRNST